MIPPEEDDPEPLGPRLRDRARAVCPYCWRRVVLHLDPGGGSVQDYVEDCPVCCRPWVVRLRFGPDGRPEATLLREDEV